jgi:hypothetical protein
VVADKERRNHGAPGTSAAFSNQRAAAMKS